MVSDAVNRDGDEGGTEEWLAADRDGPPLDEGDTSPPGMTWDGTNLPESFDIPAAAVPVRLLPAGDLNTLAAEAPLLTDLHALALKVRGGAAVRADAVDPFLLALAEALDLVQVASDPVTPGPEVAWLEDVHAAGDFLEAWRVVFAQVLDLTLVAADTSTERWDPDKDLDLTGHGTSMAVDLFYGARAGVAVADLSQMLKEAAVSGLLPEAGERAWQEWTSAHGDPAGLLLEQLVKLNAVTVTDGVARLAPLGLDAVAHKLRADGVTVPCLPPPAELTAAQIVELSDAAAPEDIGAELDGWLAARTPAVAAAELLEVAAAGSPEVRIAATDVASRVGAGAAPAWRDALGRTELRCYAKIALTTLMAEGKVDQDAAADAELRLTAEDGAWYITDYIIRGRQVQPDSAIPLDAGESGRLRFFATDEALFEAMARCGHPAAEAVLTFLGRHHDDKKTAKAARKAAYKAASRRAATSR